MTASQAVREGQAGWLPFRAVVDQNLMPPLRRSPEEQIRELMAQDVVSEEHLIELIKELHISIYTPESQELLSELLVHEGSSWRTKQNAFTACLPLLDIGLLDWWSLAYRFENGQYRTDKGNYGFEGIKRLVTLYGRIIRVISNGVTIQVNKDLRSFLGKLLDVYKDRNECNLKSAYENKGIQEWPFPAITVMQTVVLLREYSSLECMIPFYPKDGQYMRDGVLCAIPPLWWVVTEGLKKSPSETIKRGQNLHAMSVFQRMYENTSQSELPGKGLYELLAQGDANPKAVYEQLIEWFHKPWINKDGSLR